MVRFGLKFIFKKDYVKMVNVIVYYKVLNFFILLFVFLYSMVKNLLENSIVRLNIILIFRIFFDWLSELERF